MNRDDLALLLSDLVARRAITQAEAQTILARFDAGELSPEQLPLVTPPTEDDSAAWVAALVAVLLLLGMGSVRAISASQRKRARNLLRANFESDMVRLAGSVTEGSMAVGVWQAQMWDAMGDYTRQMASAGAGTLPSAATQQAIGAQLQGQWPYLLGFATLLSALSVLGRGMSQAGIAARSRLYGGVGWGGYWRGAESTRPTRQGEIVHYEARDDQNTCGPCAEAERNGPYVVGTNHPVPGSVCLGGGRCRCELRFEYNLEVWQRLTGQRRAA